jgi:hypothetical protein
MPAEPEDHDCLGFLVYRQCESIERHGLDAGPFECWRDEWWECRICGERFDGELKEKYKEGHNDEDRTGN